MSKHLSKLNNSYLYKGKWITREDLSNLEPMGKTIRKTQFLGLAVNINNEVVGITQHEITKKIKVGKITTSDKNERYVQIAGGINVLLEEFLE